MASLGWIYISQTLQDGIKLIEIDFPTASLASTAGDAEGANEMNYCLSYLRQYMRIFQANATTTRIFFPDQSELKVARQGKGMDPNAGSWNLDPVFEQTAFKLDYLTKPSGLADFGIDLSGFNPANQVQDSDQLLVAAYPHFDPREMVAVEKLWQGAAKESGRPLVLFNAELDRIRTGYYPALFYPKMGKLAKEFLPLIETVYYIHNIKGYNGGALLRAYPGPWQVFLRTTDGMKLVHSQEEPLSLKEMALEILPRVSRAARR